MKRILALILAICMIITLAPVAIFAEEENNYYICNWSTVRSLAFSNLEAYMNEETPVMSFSYDIRIPADSKDMLRNTAITFSPLGYIFNVQYDDEKFSVIDGDNFSDVTSKNSTTYTAGSWVNVDVRASITEDRYINVAVYVGDEQIYSGTSKTTSGNEFGISRVDITSEISGTTTCETHYDNIKVSVLPENSASEKVLVIYDGKIYTSTDKNASQTEQGKDQYFQLNGTKSRIYTAYNPDASITGVYWLIRSADAAGNTSVGNGVKWTTESVGSGDSGNSGSGNDTPVTPGGNNDPYLGGTLLFDYTLNKDFANTELGQQVILDEIADCRYEYKSVYTDEGVSIIKTGDPVFTDEAHKKADNVDAFGIDLAMLADNDTENHNRVYKTGFDGIYALELTFNMYGVENISSDNNSTGRADMFINDKATEYGYGGIDLRLSYRQKYLAAYHNQTATKGFDFNDRVNGKDTTVRLVIDTINKKYYGYSVLSNGEYEYEGEGVYELNQLSYFWFRSYNFTEKGDTITFKRVKMYEIEKNESSLIESEFAHFMNTVPDTFVHASGALVDPANVAEDITIPDQLVAEFTVETLRNAVITENGKIIRGLEDTIGNIKISNSGTGYSVNKIYDFNIKAKEEVVVEDYASYDYTSDKVVKELIYSGNSGASNNGFSVVSNSLADGTTIGLLKTCKESDSNTNTYYYDHNGAYDFELTVIPEITTGKGIVEIGSYNYLTGKFEAYGNMYIDSTGVYHADKYENIEILSEDTSSKEYKLKFRTDTENSKIWHWANSNVAVLDGSDFKNTSGIINAYRVCFENAGENDKLTLVSGNFKKLIFKDFEQVSKLLNAISNVKMADVTSKPEDAYGDIDLPLVAGYNVEWKSNNPLADIEAKKVYRSEEDENITLTATITHDDNPRFKVEKEFNIIVKKATDTKELLEGALSRITADSLTNQNPEALVADLMLPVTTQEGYSVTWKSLSTDYISDDGKINRTINISQNQDVTLTATVSYNGESLSKNIAFRIAKRGKDVTLNTMDITEYVEGVVTYQATVSGSNGTTYLKDDEGRQIIGFVIEDSKLSFDYRNAVGTKYDVADNFDIRIVMNSEDKCASVYVDNKPVLDYIPYIADANGFAKVESSGITLVNDKVVFDEYSLFDYNVKVYDYFDAFENVFISNNVNLVNTTLGGAIVEWNSGNTAILSNDGKTFVNPEAISFFDFTFTIRMNNGTDAYMKKVINCVAVPAESNNIMTDATVSIDIEEDVNNKKANAFDNNFSTFFGAKKLKTKDFVIIDLGAEKEINSLYFFQIAKDMGMTSCDIYLSNDNATWGSAVASPVFTDLNSNLVTFEYQTARYVKITNMTGPEDSFKLYELKGYINYSSSNKASFDIAALNMPTEYTLNQASLTMPNVGPVYGSTMTWTSSDESVISKNGTVTKPYKTTEVILTVTAEYEGVTATKSYTYLVTGTATSGTPAGGGGGGSYAGNVSGVNTGGTDISALPTNPEVELDKVEYPKVETGIFKDTKKTDWYYEYVVSLTEKGIVNGYDDGNFYPNKQVTREEFLKMLIIAMDIEPAEISGEFTDVDSDKWYAPYVYAAKAKGIAKGTSDNTFGVGIPVTRQDMSVMAYNSLGINIDVAANVEIFKDHMLIAPYSFNAVYAMKTIGVLDGYESGEFVPNGYLTRAEAVKVIALISRMIKN